MSGEHASRHETALGLESTPTACGATPEGNDGGAGAVSGAAEERCPSCGGDAGNNNFDRSLCACGAMHTYCNNCGWPLDFCAYSDFVTEGDSPTPEDDGWVYTTERVTPPACSCSCASTVEELRAEIQRLREWQETVSVGATNAATAADEAIAELAALHQAKPHYVTSQGSADDPVGHDGWECEPHCDACYFASENSKLRASVAELREALERIDRTARWYADNPQRDPHEVDFALCVEILDMAGRALAASPPGGQKENEQ